MSYFATRDSWIRTEECGLVLIPEGSSCYETAYGIAVVGLGEFTFSE